MTANVCVVTGCDGSIDLAAARFTPKEKILVISGRDAARLAAAERELAAMGLAVHSWSGTWTSTASGSARASRARPRQRSTER